MSNKIFPKGTVVTLRDEGISIVKLTIADDPKIPCIWGVVGENDHRTFSDKAIALNPKRFTIEAQPGDAA